MKKHQTMHIVTESEIDPLKDLFSELIEQLGEDPTREGLLATPYRAAKAFRFLTKGYQGNLEEIINGALYPAVNDEMILVDNIEFYSICEHHLLPFFGKCHIGYIPDKKWIGLSKFARIVDMFSQRLQIQETLTQQIAEAIQTATQAKGVGVVLVADHLCMKMRGVEKERSSFKTMSMLGNFKQDASIRKDFFHLIQNLTSA